MPKVTLLGDTIPKQYLLCVYSRRGLALRDLHIADRGVRESSGAKKHVSLMREAGKKLVFLGAIQALQSTPLFPGSKTTLSVAKPNCQGGDILRSANTEDTANYKNDKGQKY